MYKCIILKFDTIQINRMDEVEDNIKVVVRVQDLIAIEKVNLVKLHNKILFSLDYVLFLLFIF